MKRPYAHDDDINGILEEMEEEIGVSSASSTAAGRSDQLVRWSDMVGLRMFGERILSCREERV